MTDNSICVPLASLPAAFGNNVFVLYAMTPFALLGLAAIVFAGRQLIKPAREPREPREEFRNLLKSLDSPVTGPVTTSFQLRELRRIESYKLPGGRVLTIAAGSLHNFRSYPDGAVVFGASETFGRRGSAVRLCHRRYWATEPNEITIQAFVPDFNNVAEEVENADQSRLDIMQANDLLANAYRASFDLARMKRQICLPLLAEGPTQGSQTALFLARIGLKAMIAWATEQDGKDCCLRDIFWVSMHHEDLWCMRLACLKELNTVRAINMAKF